jgi:hypothetical protein
LLAGCLVADNYRIQGTAGCYGSSDVFLKNMFAFIAAQDFTATGFHFRLTTFCRVIKRQQLVGAWKA